MTFEQDFFYVVIPQKFDSETGTWISMMELKQVLPDDRTGTFLYAIAEGLIGVEGMVRQSSTNEDTHDSDVGCRAYSDKAHVYMDVLVSAVYDTPIKLDDGTVGSLRQYLGPEFFDMLLTWIDAGVGRLVIHS